jgi:hypothetical protein
VAETTTLLYDLEYLDVNRTKQVLEGGAHDNECLKLYLYGRLLAGTKVFIYYLFNDATRSWDYIIPKGWMINEVERMWPI